MAKIMFLLLAVCGIAMGAQGRMILADAPAPSPMVVAASYFVQPKLPYSFDANEPFIDTRTNTIHWTKHLATYYANLNAAAAKNSTLQSMPVLAIVQGLNTSTDKAVRNNAGGVFNHLIFFKTLQAPTAQTNATNNTALPTEIASAIEQSFTNFAIFKKNFTESALGVFGSGWAWLTYNSTSKGLAIETTPNQDNPISSGLGYSGNTPLVGIDVWEHAYYLKHQNVRADYIKDWFYVVNWPQVNDNYKAAMNGDRNALISYSSS